MSPEPEPTAALSPEQTAAQAQLDAIMADKSHPYHVRGHPRSAAATDEVLALRRVLTAAAPLVTYREAGDQPVQAAPVQPLEPDEPALVGTARFDAGMVAQLDAALVDAGLSRYTGTMLRGVLAQEHNQGTLGTWSEEASREHLAKKYGLEASAELIEHAQAAGRLLPASVKQWLLESGAHTNPRIILEAAMLWRRSRHARR